jgi:hypothetical protein
MINTIVDSAIITRLQQALTVLQDDFGVQMNVQTNLTAPGADHVADVARATAVMQANETAFVAQMLAMGMSQDQIDTHKVK